MYLDSGLKKRGVKPFAGFIYAAFHAYKHVEHAKPYVLVQQASMQSRSYYPEHKELTIDKFQKDRRFVGDWLIGCLHYFKEEEFTLEQAQRVYETLVEDLNEMKGSAAAGAMAKAYNPLGGAAVFQFFPFCKVTLCCCLIDSNVTLLLTYCHGHADAEKMRVMVRDVGPVSTYILYEHRACAQLSFFLSTCRMVCFLTITDFEKSTRMRSYIPTTGVRHFGSVSTP